MEPGLSRINKCEIDPSSKLYDFVNLYGCKIGKNTKIDSFVYIEGGVVIGDHCKVRPFVFIPSGVTIGSYVFIGPGVVFTNDRYPQAQGEWKQENTVIEDNVSIGAGSVVLPGVRIGKGSLIAAGSTVVRDVPPNSKYISKFTSHVSEYRK